MAIVLSTRQLSTIGAIASACLFACGMPASKVLVQKVHPTMLAGLFYLGSGLGLSCILTIKDLLQPKEKVSKSSGLTTNGKEFRWLLAVTLIGGVVAPLSLMFAMSLAKASSVALLLNLEIVCTVLIAWFYFHERLSRREIFGIALITLGGVSLSWGGSPELCWALLFAAFAAFCWAVDSNLTARIAHMEPLGIARFKGLVAGSLNLLFALILGARCSDAGTICSALSTGLLCYGLSLSAFIFSMRYLGAARAVAYFALEPFIGSLLSIIFLKEMLSVNLLVGGLFMTIGVILHFTASHPTKENA